MLSSSLGAVVLFVVAVGLVVVVVVVAVVVVVDPCCDGGLLFAGYGSYVSFRVTALFRLEGWLEKPPWQRPN